MNIKKTCIDYLNEYKQKCCGCGACNNVCPFSAISMHENDKGFLTPIIDESKCTKCGLCLSVCPIFNVKEESAADNPINNIPLFKYAFSGCKEILQKSSSGGAFTYIANFILKNNGYVVGAAYVDNNFTVGHIIIDSISNLSKLRYSKYVQSNQGECYKKVKKLLLQGKTVLYTGTPCQIAGLKGYLGNKDYMNLYTIDLLCHGVPSPRIFRDYLSYFYEINNIKEICMRRKEEWASCFDVEFKNGDIQSKSMSMSLYISSFLSDLTLRDSCYGCKFAKLPRHADITLGDCWNSKKLKLGAPFDSKSSIVLVNNLKGKELWEKSLNEENSDYHIKDISDINNKLLNKNISAPNQRYSDNVEKFWSNYNNMNFNESYFKTRYGDKAVGLVLYSSNNYGSCATNLALYLAIENMGYTPIILNSLVPMRGISKNYLSKNCRLCPEVFVKDDFYTINKLFNKFVVGSDYSFNITAGTTRKYLEYFLMGFVESNNKKIAYAPSLGLPDFEHDEYTKAIYKHLLSRFDFLSFREDSAVEHCKKYLGLDSKYVMDPVFLVNQGTYKNISMKSKLNIKEKYILAYILDASAEKVELIQKYSNRLGIKSLIILDINNYEKNATFFKSGLLGKLAFEDFIYYYINAEFIITDSFHGTCFSLIFNKKYISLKNRNRKRFDALINFMKVKVNFIPIFNNTLEASRVDVFNQDYNFEVINNILDNCRTECSNMLMKALSEKTSTKYNDSVEMNVDLAKLWKSNFSLQNQLKKLEIEINNPKANKQEVTNNSHLSDKYTFLWTSLRNQIQNQLPSRLIFSGRCTEYLYKIYIEGINPRIHFELFDKNNAFYLGIHCEDKELQKYCESEFESIKKVWKIDASSVESKFKLNKNISLSTAYKTIPIYIRDVWTIIEKFFDDERFSSKNK